jgi:MFS family permease
MIAYALPMAFLGPVAGAFVDRWEVKPTMIASSVARAVFVAALAYTTRLNEFYVLIFLASLGGTLLQPAQTVAIPMIVRNQELLVANAVATQTLQLTKIVGPGVAGLVIAALGEKTCFLIGAGLFLAAAAVQALLPLSERPRKIEGSIAEVGREIRDGLRFIVHNRAILFVAVSMIAGMFAIGIFDSLIPVYVRDELEERTSLFGGLLSVVGIGTIAGATLIGRYAQPVSRVKLVLAGLLTIGVSVFGIAAWPNPFGALGCSLLLGAGIAAIMVSAQTLLQEQAPAGMLGRVTSTGIAIVTVSQLAAFTAGGQIAEHTGIRPLFFGASALLLLTAAYGFLRIRMNRDVE